MADLPATPVALAAATQLVVRVDGTWALTPPEERDPTPVGLDELLALLRGGEEPPRSTVTTTVLPDGLHPLAELGPVGPVVAKLGAGCLVVEDPNGRHLTLDEVDVVLWDAVVDDATAEQVMARAAERLGPAGPEVDELRGRLRRLVEAVPLRLLFDPRPEWVPPPAPTPVSVLPARRLRKVVRHAVPARWRSELRRRVGADEPTAAMPSRSTAVPYLEDPVPADDAAPGRVPVYAVWQVDVGPALSLGMLTAAARHHAHGVLRGHYELRRPEDPASCLDDLDGRQGPAVLLCSNYVWSLEHNLEVARRAKERNPQLLVVHGGPSTPKGEEDAHEFFATHGDLVDVAVRGEGEATLVALLEALAPHLPTLRTDALAEVAGLTFRAQDGSVVRTEDRDRIADLDELPSPYLTGEFDHLDPSVWEQVTLETNRGCPYGCTFCDWGSSTLARIRKFSLERVRAEMEWAGGRRLMSWTLGDANFGITSRDVETTELMVEVKERFGVPNTLGFNVAKNTTKHLTAIIDRMVSAGIAPVFSLALQTRDEATLEAVRRQNISADHYVALAASLRRRRLPVQADLMVALPGQTVDSLADDLQFLLDHEISGRMWITHMLPNAPINEPEYRAQWDVRADERGLVISTSTFTEADRAEMLRLRHAYTVFERFGVLRHVLRHLQWDEGLPAIATTRALLALADEHPTRYPLLSWILHHFDRFNAPPLGWRAFMDELRTCLVRELDAQPSSALDTVLALQAALLPAHGRRFPDTIPLDHDYLSYFRAHTLHLWGGIDAPEPPRLEQLGPASFTVYGDPLGRCDLAIQHIPDARDEKMTDNFWMAGHWELDSPLVFDYAEVAAAGSYVGVHEQVPADLPPEPSISANEERLASIRVNLRARAASVAD